MANISSGYMNPVGSCDVVPPLAKKSQSVSQKRGCRKKTLSLNPEEREALENLIEEVILDGGMGESESGSSDEENKVSEDLRSYANPHETTLNNPKALASIKMPKKYYPGQLKVALKHMTDLPPRFSRKLKKAERYLELNAAAAASKKIISHASIKEEDEEEIASINAGNTLNFPKNDLQNISPSNSRSPKNLSNIKTKYSKDNQMKDLKKTIRTLLTDLDQYVDESDRTSLSLDLPGAVNCSDIEKDAMYTSKKASGSQSSDDSKSQSGINEPMSSYPNHARRNPYIDSPYSNNHSPNLHQGKPRKMVNTSYKPNNDGNYQTARNFKSSPSASMHTFSPALLTSQNITGVPPQPPGMLPSNMDIPGIYFMPVQQPGPYYHSIPPQNYSIPPPPFLQYPPPRFPMHDNFLSYPPPYPSSDYPYQPPTNPDINQYGQLGTQMQNNYKVLPITDPSKVNPFVYQTMPPNQQPPNSHLPNPTFHSSPPIQQSNPDNSNHNTLSYITNESVQTVNNEIITSDKFYRGINLKHSRPQTPNTTLTSPSTIPTFSDDSSSGLSQERERSIKNTAPASKGLNAHSKVSTTDSVFESEQEMASNTASNVRGSNSSDGNSVRNSSSGVSIHSGSSGSSHINNNVSGERYDDDSVNKIDSDINNLYKEIGKVSLDSFRVKNENVQDNIGNNNNIINFVNSEDNKGMVTDYNNSKNNNKHNEYIADMRMVNEDKDGVSSANDKNNGDEGNYDDDDGGGGLSIILSQSFIKKLVARCSKDNGTDIDKVQDTRIRLDDDMLKNLYDAIVLKNGL